MSDNIALDITFLAPFLPGTSTDTCPLFIAADGVHGIVNISYDGTDSVTPGARFIKLCLSGVIQVRIPCDTQPFQNHGSYFSLYKQKVLNIVTVLPIQHVCTASLSVQQTSVRFDLALPSTLSELVRETGSHELQPEGTTYSTDCLPSSLAANTILSTSAYEYGHRVEARVVYDLHAHAISRGNVIASVAKKIRIFDSADPQPPICLLDFVGEYLCYQKKVLRKHIFTKVGALSASIAEPHPFVFSNKNNIISTTMSISFVKEVINTKQSGNLHSRPDSLDATLTWRLKASTFASIEPMNAVPTVREVNDKSRSHVSQKALITVNGLEHQSKLSLRNWTKIPDTSSIDSKRLAVETWTTSNDIVLLIPRDTFPVPSFFTPFICRRYSLLVRLSVAGNGKATLRFEVPIQITYRDKSKSTYRPDLRNSSNHGDLCEWNDPEQVTAENAHETLPIYVR